MLPDPEQQCTENLHSSALYYNRNCVYPGELFGPFHDLHFCSSQNETLVSLYWQSGYSGLTGQPFFFPIVLLTFMSSMEQVLLLFSYSNLVVSHYPSLHPLEVYFLQHLTGTSVSTGPLGIKQ